MQVTCNTILYTNYLTNQPKHQPTTDIFHIQTAFEGA